MNTRIRTIAQAAVGLVATVLYLTLRDSDSDHSAPEATERVVGSVGKGLAVPVKSITSSNASPAGTDHPIRVHSGQVLAKVNGHAITIDDAWPRSGSASPEGLDVLPESYHYLLDRAINRELIFQAAERSGVRLTDSQRTQLTQMRALRAHAEPGRVVKLNAAPGRSEFELRDAEAFMLQSSLMSGKGFSPDVTEKQVQTYYAEHQSEFGAVPSDETREQVWSGISFQIRQHLAPAARSQFNTRLSSYMNELKSTANIEIALPDLVGTN